MSLDELLREALRLIESTGDYPDALLYVNYDYLFRPPGLFDEIIRDAQLRGYDTVFPGLTDFGHYWFQGRGGTFKQSDVSLKPRDQRQPAYRALYGLGCLSSAWVIRRGRMVGGKVGIQPLDDPKSALRLREFDIERIQGAIEGGHLGSPRGTRRGGEANRSMAGERQASRPGPGEPARRAR
jgi:hypothetical protein